MILDRLGKELIYFDGGTGTLLQERGLKPGELPETWSLEHADDMIDIARQYYEAGSDIVLSNTFGANALKFHDSRYKLDEIVKASKRCRTWCQRWKRDLCRFRYRTDR